MTPTSGRMRARSLVLRERSDWSGLSAKGSPPWPYALSPFTRLLTASITSALEKGLVM
jgi:hypothetical protein